MKRIRQFVTALAAVTLVSMAAHAQKAEANRAEELIADLGDRALQVLVVDEQSEKQRLEAFRKLLHEGFDLQLIGRYALGRHWRRTSPEQKEEYNELFEDFILSTYATRLGQYSGETLKVTGSRKDDEDTIVTSDIVRQGKPAIKVDWRVRNTDDGPKIVDVVVEGVSMLLTQRDEFASVIQRAGGDVEGLLTRLRSKKLDP